MNLIANSACFVRPVRPAASLFLWSDWHLMVRRNPMTMNRLAPLTLLLLLAPAAASADEQFPGVAPTEPERAEATFEVLHGFRMQLIAAEPHVASPVDV